MSHPHNELHYEASLIMKLTTDNADFSHASLKVIPAVALVLETGIVGGGGAERYRGRRLY